MTLSSRICSERQDLNRLAPEWDRILRSCRNGVHGPDATCSSVWATALSETLLRDAEMRTLVVADGTESVAILPTYRRVTNALPFRKREVRIVTEAHAGRAGLLVAHNDPDLVEFALERLRSDFPPWDVFVFGVVENSASHGAVTQAARRLHMRLHCVASSESPYFELGASWEKLLATLPKKMRWTIRKSESDLRGRGRIEYEEVTDSGSVGPLLESILEIERASWKERAGTSITAQERQQRFLVSLANLAARHGVLSGHILRLGGKPIAHLVGIAAGDGVFLDLKESFDAAYAQYSPGHILKRFAIEKLISRGVGIYDFMGDCEPYKMRWTEKTYRRMTLALFNRTFAGSFWHLRSRLSAHSRPVC